MIGYSISRLSSISSNVLRKIPQNIGINTVRHGHRMRGKPPGIARSITQRLEELDAVDEEIAKSIDIGFPAIKRNRSEEFKMKTAFFMQQKKDPNRERAARLNQLEADLDSIREEWLKSNGQSQIKEIAKHYGIYEHLFGYAHFTPRIPLDIKYAISEDTVAPVYYGNTLKPGHAKYAPEVSFDASIKLAGDKSGDNSLWTLVLTNPDGHLKQLDSEYVHWFIGNIPNSDVSKGEIIVPYLQPFPPRGTGFHRHIFVLYKQDKKIDFNEYKVNEVNDLDKRTFKTFDFYRKHQDNITPAGLAFFQSDWDTNVTDTFHNLLNMKEPIYEYDFPKSYNRDETYFPLRAPFNLYLDRYRDQKQINKEYLARELQKTHPFNGPKPAKRFPAAHPLKDIPSWLINEKKKSRLGWGRINEIK